MFQEKLRFISYPYKIKPQLRNWPVKIHLLPLKTPYYQKADLLIAADCCAYAYAEFHNDFIKGHTLAVGCPKLDNTDAYKDKLKTILSKDDIKSITIAYIEVPCCTELVKVVEDAVIMSGKTILIKRAKIVIQGQIIS